MTHRSANFLTTARRRSRLGRGLAFALAAALTVSVSVLASPASAMTGSAFEGGDGNLTPITGLGGATDWTNVPFRSTGNDNPLRSLDNAFGQGTKEDIAAVSVVDGSIPPNKNDLSRFYEASATSILPGATFGHVYLNLAWERLVNIGNANLDFEINHAATPGFTIDSVGPVTLNRTEGDMLVTYDFPGGGTPALGLNRWLTTAVDPGTNLPIHTKSQCLSASALPCWGSHSNLGAASEGAVNGVVVNDPIVSPAATPAPGDLAAGVFGEASIDLTQAGVFAASGSFRAIRILIG